MYLQHNQLDTVKPIITATFPRYGGTTVQIKPSEQAPTQLDSYWDGGSKESYALYRLDTREVLSVHSNHPFFEPNQPRRLAALPANILLVHHTIFCGKDLGITIYGDLSHLLPAPTLTATPEERIVLVATRSLKNSYGGKTGIRKREAMEETGITADAYDAAYAACITKGYLTHAGAITATGKNLAGTDSLHACRLPGIEVRTTLNSPQ